MSTPLYQLVAHKAELEQLEASDDLPAEAIVDTLEALEGELEAKVTNIAAFTRNLDADAAAIRAAGKAMLARAERLESRAERIRAYLLFNMVAAGISKISCPWFTVQVKRNPPAVTIFDELLLPAEYFAPPPPPPPPKPDKAKIKDALKAGVDVPGAGLTSSDRLEVKE